MDTNFSIHGHIKQATENVLTQILLDTDRNNNEKLKNRFVLTQDKFRNDLKKNLESLSFKILKHSTLKYLFPMLLCTAVYSKKIQAGKPKKWNLKPPTLTLEEWVVIWELSRYTVSTLLSSRATDTGVFLFLMISKYIRKYIWNTYAINWHKNHTTK